MLRPSAWWVAIAIATCSFQARAQPEPDPTPASGQPGAEPATPAPEPAPGKPATVPPAATAPSRAPLPPPPTAADETCEAGWVARVYRETHRSVVKIDSGGGLGAGFIFPTQKYVATAFHVVSLGHPILVTLVTGKSISAKIVAYDPGNDLAILELDEPVTTIEPLRLSEDPVAELGSPVVAIGHPYGNAGETKHRGLLGWSVSQGIVSGSGPSLVQTDAALNPGNSGGPVLGCDGRVIGVASAKARGEGVGFAVAGMWLRKLTEKMHRQGDYDGLWQVSGLGGMTFHGNPDEGLLGFQLGLALIAGDRWFGALTFEQLWDVTLPDQPPEVFDLSRSRSALGLTLGHRWLLLTGLPIHYASIGVGGVVARDATEVVRFAGSYDPTCTTPPCPTTIRAVTSDTSDWFGWPAVVLGAQLLGVFELSYSFMPDVRDLTSSVHRGTLGLAL
jgi:S1-C subfamily serine protease